jgi:hypothetical protein
MSADIIIEPYQHGLVDLSKLPPEDARAMRQALDKLIASWRS